MSDIPKIEDVVDTEFGRNWVQSVYSVRRGVLVILPYIDINDGNHSDGTVFSQIMYWHEPNDQGEMRLRRHGDGKYWLAKNHSDWFSETRIKAQAARDCLERIRDRKLIFYELHGEIGLKTPWMRVNWIEFERRMRLWIQNMKMDISEDQYKNAIQIFKLADYKATEDIPVEIITHPM